VKEGKEGESSECGSESDEDMGTGGSVTRRDLGSPVVSSHKLFFRTKGHAELTQHFDDSSSRWRDTIQSYQTMHQLIVSKNRKNELTRTSLALVSR
jgi:hypothetical protein